MNDFSSSVVLILAGGLSQRAGELKGLRIFSGKYWIERQIEYYSNLKVRYIFTGLGYNHQEYIKAIPLLSQSINSTVLTGGTQVQSIINPKPEMEMFSTIINCLESIIEQPWENLLLIHVDMAFPRRDTLEKLYSFSEKKVVKPVYAGSGKSGHPVLLSREFCQELIRLPENSENRLDIQIRKLTECDIQRVIVDDHAVNINMNTHTEWETYLDSFNLKAVS